MCVCVSVFGCINESFTNVFSKIKKCSIDVYLSFCVILIFISCIKYNPSMEFLLGVEILLANNYNFIIIIIIIIMLFRRQGYPWPSLATSSYRSSPLAGLQGYIPYPHIATGCMFELVVLLLPGHMWGSIGVHHLWARLCFSSSDLHVWFV